jgi:hypothetical protein
MRFDTRIQDCWAFLFYVAYLCVCGIAKAAAILLALELQPSQSLKFGAIYYTMVCYTFSALRVDRMQKGRLLFFACYLMFLLFTTMAVTCQFPSLSEQRVPCRTISANTIHSSLAVSPC